MIGFSGSYVPEDVTFLMKEVVIDGTDIENKEQHIKQGGHYSEVLTLENAPSPAYMALYREVLDRNKTRFAKDVLQLASRIAADQPDEIVVVSLARAGTPVGVLLNRALNQLLGRKAVHYCVSIIRDKGLDLNAVRHIVAQHGYKGIVFVDGWTGKGVIGRELSESVHALNQAEGWALSPNLYVVADIAGSAYFAATHDDYLLPSAILNSTVSGLISRTVLTPAIKYMDFHGCVRYTHLESVDESQAFVDEVFAEMVALELKAIAINDGSATGCGASLLDAIQRYQTLYGIDNINLVKPGVGESTRVMLRRKPRLLVLREKDALEVQHLVFLANQREVPVLCDAALPCQALALIDHAD